jgi:hypothetical protein
MVRPTALAVLAAGIIVTSLVAAARAAPPTVTPSPGYDARLQEQRKAMTTTSPSNKSAAPANPSPTPRHHVKRTSAH